MKKSVLFLSAITTIALIGCVGGNQKNSVSSSSSSASQESSSVAQKKYFEDQFGLAFTYPGSWNLEIKPDQTLKGTDLVFDIGVVESHETINIQTTTKDAVQKFQNGLEKSVILAVKPVTIGGKQGTEIDTSEFGMSYLFVENGEFLFRFETGGWMQKDGLIDSIMFTKPGAERMKDCDERKKNGMPCE
jgi:hypothetical protein